METLGKYGLLKKLAVGGMAEIWVATTSDAGVQRVCVVKRILPHLAETPDFVRMFLDEARIVATLTHPNLVQLFDVGEAGGRPFIAMEYLHGADVRAIKRALRNRERGPMPLEHALSIGMGAAAGLHYAHEKVGLDGRPLNIVHRDISPQNILVTYDGGVKVLDFGIAKSDQRSTETQAGTLKGKVPYMSPEQCLCESLDRRSDIYSLGVVLYELTTGRRAVPSTTSEYELIRAIVEGGVTPPTQLDPAYPQALEAILLRCLAKERARRYPTARALLVDLEAFAREERLATSQLSLGSFMGDLFGARAEAWREALAAGGAQLAQLAVGDERDPAADAGPDAKPARPYGALLEARKRPATAETPRATEAVPTARPPAPAAALDAGGDLTVTRRRAGDVEVFALAGRVNERFQGKNLGRALAGRVVLDLAGITRFTSFGVREWLQMLGEAGSAHLYFARCPEPVVNQLSMIKGFAGSGAVISFTAPYRCEGCGASFERLIDCERDGGPLREGRAPDAPCPRCGEAAVFDDDAESFLAFAAPYAGAPVPADVRAALADLDRQAAAPGEAVEKTIDGRRTRVGVRGNLDASVRWKRALDGIEGELEIDLAHVTAVAPEGAAALENALRALGPEVESARVLGCPRSLAERLLAAEGRARAALTSVQLEGRCAPCNAARTAVVSIADLRDAAREGRDPYAPCKRCSTPLTFAGARAFSALLDRDEAHPSDPISAHGRTSAAQVTPARPAGGGGSSRALIIAGAGAAAAIAIAAIALPRRSPPPAPAAETATAAATTAAPAPASAESAAPPAWIATPIAVEGGDVLAVGHGSGPTEEAALHAAREDALDRLAAHLLDDIASTPAGAFARARLPRDNGRRAEALAAVAARWSRQLGGKAVPERADAYVDHKGSTHDVTARYRLTKAGYDAARAFYTGTESAAGMTLAPVFPLLERTIRTPGEVIVIALDKGGAAARAGVREGDVVLAIDGKPVTSVAAASAGTGAMDLKIEEGGAARVIKLKR